MLVLGLELRADRMDSETWRLDRSCLFGVVVAAVVVSVCISVWLFDLFCCYWLESLSWTDSRFEICNPRKVFCLNCEGRHVRKTWLSALPNEFIRIVFILEIEERNVAWFCEGCVRAEEAISEISWNVLGETDNYCNIVDNKKETYTHHKLFESIS